MKPGYKTTEFYVALLVTIGSTLFAIADKLPARYAAGASTIAAGAYALSRGLAKVYPPRPGP